MGLIDRARRARYVYGWRLRYWWLDTRGGAETRVTLFCLMVLTVIVQLIRLCIAALLPPPPGEPVKAVVWWVVVLIVAVVAGALAWALRPKTEQPKPQDAEGPITDDGQSIIRFWGTCWFDSAYMAAWKVIGRDPIRASGGK